MRPSPRPAAGSQKPGRHGPVSWRAPWRIVETRFDPAYRAYAESIFSQANGYLGIRGDFEESSAPGESYPIAFVAGVYDHPPRLPDELVNLPIWYRFAVRLRGRTLGHKGSRLVAYRRALSMRDGVLARFITIQDERGRRTRIRFTRFLSGSDQHITAQRVRITPLNWSGDVSVRPYLDAGVSNQSGWLYDVLSTLSAGAGDFSLEARTRRSRVRVAMASACAGASSTHWRAYLRGDSVGSNCRARLSKGETLSLERYTAIISSRESRSHHLAQQALALARQARAEGFGSLLARHRAAWESRWEQTDVSIEGDPVRANALRFCLFQLMQAAPLRDDRISIGAKGLTGEWYRGHFFWDTEMFMLPFFIYTDPRVACNLATYRWRTLPGARANARAAGYRGAMYAWEAALNGREQTPQWIHPPGGGPRVRVWTGEREHHITADVAFGAWHYSAAAGDEPFRTGPGAQVLIETTRFWASRVHTARDGHRDVLGVIGPDEFHENVDNNAFTNHLASWTLRKAADLVDELRRRRSVWPRLKASLRIQPQEPRRWRRIAAAIRQPAVRGGVIEQHQGFFTLAQVSPGLLVRESPLTRHLSLEEINRSQVLKQADVLMLLTLFPGLASRQVARRNWDYYEPRTAHDSSLSASIHAAAAADLGLMDEALHYFDWACQLDLSDRQGNTWQGLHAAALGGAWLAAVRGFGGLRLGQDATLRVSPALPPAWRRMRFTAAYRGGRLAVEATRRRVALRYSHPEGRPAGVVVYGRLVTLKPGARRRFAARGPRR